MRYKQRIERLFFHQFFENLVGYFIVRHARIDFDAELGATLAASFARVVKPFGIDLANQIMVTGAPPRPGQIDGAGHVPFGVAMLDSEGRASACPWTRRSASLRGLSRRVLRQILRQMASQLLNQVRYLLEIGVGPIGLQHGKLWIMFS